jgi:hypothetical protein
MSNTKTATRRAGLAAAIVAVAAAFGTVVITQGAAERQIVAEPTKSPPPTTSAPTTTYKHLGGLKYNDYIVAVDNKGPSPAPSTTKVMQPPLNPVCEPVEAGKGKKKCYDFSTDTLE